jgi:hypothetical protein
LNFRNDNGFGRFRMDLGGDDLLLMNEVRAGDFAPDLSICRDVAMRALGRFILAMSCPARQSS